MSLVKSKQRVADHGEVFTPPWLVEAMLQLVADETQRLDARFLEPACGSGHFLVPILQRKLAAARLRYAPSHFDLHHFSLLGLMCLYGIELLPDNIAECRANLLAVFDSALGLAQDHPLHRAAAHVLSQNIVHGDALTLRTHDGRPIAFPEWGYLGKGRFNRRDFRYDHLAESSAFNAQDTLFAHAGKHNVFTPTQTYPPLTVADLAAMAPEPAP